MAMSGSVLGTAIYNKIISGKLDADASEEVLKIWQEIADVIVSHIQSNAVVSVTVATTGTAAAQSGSGTGTIS